MKEPLTDEQIWGYDSNYGRDTRCTKHPNKEGFVDLGQDAENRYPCYECYAELCARRKNERSKK